MGPRPGGPRARIEQGSWGHLALGRGCGVGKGLKPRV